LNGRGLGQSRPSHHEEQSWPPRMRYRACVDLPPPSGGPIRSASAHYREQTRNAPDDGHQRDAAAATPPLRLRCMPWLCGLVSAKVITYRAYPTHHPRPNEGPIAFRLSSPIQSLSMVRCFPSRVAARRAWQRGAHRSRSHQ